MVKVRIKYTNDLINNVVIEGHADYAKLGKDIVCASISSITITTINALLRFDKNCVNYTSGDGLVKINVLKNNKSTDILLNNMIDLLKELEKDYKKNIKIIEEV